MNFSKVKAIFGVRGYETSKVMTMLCGLQGFGDRDDTGYTIRLDMIVDGKNAKFARLVFYVFFTPKQSKEKMKNLK